MTNKEIIGDPMIINGRKLSLSRAVRAGDYLFLTGQVPMVDDKVMTDGTIEEQTKVVLNEIHSTLVQAGCNLSHIVKTNKAHQISAIYQ